MADTLTRIKRRLNIDQRNLGSGEVLSIGNGVARVRLRDGTEHQAYLPDGVDISTGDLAQITLDGAVATVQGVARLQQLSGQVTVWI